MKILITGAKGFIGKNLVATLSRTDEIYEYDTDTNPSLLDTYCADCDYVIHLAGVNRPENQSEYMEGNYGFTAALLDILKTHGNTCPILMSSSIQAEFDTPYGQSKKAGEDLLFAYAAETGAKVIIYRFPNVFGKWCKPNYNSVIATFCNNIARDLPITITDSRKLMTLIYIDDLINEITGVIHGNEKSDIKQYEITLGEIADLIYSFKTSRDDRSVIDTSDSFTAKLYATYLTYLPESGFAYPLKMNSDDRGSFTEILRTDNRGQFSVNIVKPGIAKGNHWHHTKNEKFVIVSGNGVVRFRKLGTEEVIECFVSGDKIEVVDVPPGYTHHVANLGDCDMVTFIWCSECFDPNNPDTFFEEV